MDGTVALFDTATGKLLHTLDGHFKPVRDLCFTPGAWFGFTALSCQLSPRFSWHAPAPCLSPFEGLPATTSPLLICMPCLHWRLSA
jgi:WD40 repeat protein